MEDGRTNEMAYSDARMDEIEHAANAAVASVDASHFASFVTETPDTTQDSIDVSRGNNNSNNGKIKRARSAQKITRNRKITSCLQCRERKQKCDRQRPVCSNCNSGQSRGGMCTYLDTSEAIQELLASEGERNASRTRKREASEVLIKSEAGPSRLFSRVPQISPALAAQRLNLIMATHKAGRDRSLDFEIRVRCSRAAAVGSVLFGQPQSSTSDGSPQLYSPPAAVDTLKLPSSAEIGTFLDIYRTNVEWMCNVVVVDLNRTRITNFLDWYHSNPQTLPADPPLVPLVLVILALAIQARRTMERGTLEENNKSESLVDTDVGAGGIPGSRAHTPKDEFVSSCSSEKELLETAARCIDSLQIACPSNWASAYSAPLDLVRANLLRGLWHLSELHLQFAGSCFAVTARLAHAAALNRDSRHWQSMGKEEAQARRNIFWNVATFEMLHSTRVIQPSTILQGGYDTSFPQDHEALLTLYKRAGLIEPYIVDGRRSSIRVRPMSKANFDFHLARFQLTDVLIAGTQIGRNSRNSPHLAEKYEAWKKNLPRSLESVLDKNELGTLGGPSLKKLAKTNKEDEEETQTRFLQDALLQMTSLSTKMQIHRPQVDDTGRWRPPEGQAQRSLEICIDSAQRQIWLIWSVVSRIPGPPFVMYNFCIFYSFQAAIIIAIQSALCGNLNDPMAFSVLARPSLDKAVRTLDLVASKDGLRLVAEQANRYSNTLREIDIAQQRSKMGQASSIENKQQRQHQSGLGSVPGAAIGAPPPIIAEGSGKALGGQGYPSRHVSRSTSPISPHDSYLNQGKEVQHQQYQFQLQVSKDDSRNGTNFSANQFDEGASQNNPTGFDFSDLGLISTQAQSDSTPQIQYPLGEYYGERPLHELYGSTSTSISQFTKGQYIEAPPTGLDLLAAQVEQARHITQNHWVTGAEGKTRLNEHQSDDLGTWNTATNSLEAAQAQQSPPPPASYNNASNPQSNDYSWSNEGVANNNADAIPASAPAIESLGESFATDWDEWEKVVNRLLHSD